MRKLLLCFLLFVCSIAKAQFVWQNPITTGERFHALHFFSPLLGWAGGDVGTLLNTTDGGLTWNKQSLGTCDNVMQIQFVSSTEGWTVAGNKLYHTIDGGNSWINFPVLSYNVVSYVDFISSVEGWVRTEGGLLYTNDAGLSWTLKNASVSSLFKFANTRKGWQITPFGGVKYSTDGGSTWSTQVSGVSENILSINIIDSNEVWMCGVSGLIHTVNAGTNWIVNIPCRLAIGSTLPFFTDCHFSDAATGWAISPIYESLLSTTNGGLSWQVHPVKGELVYCADSLNGVIAGDYLCTTSNTAASVNNVFDAVTYNSLNSIHFADSLNGWTVGDSGAILHTTSSGAVWIQQNVITSSDLKSVFTINSNEAWIAGNLSDSLLHTVDAGLSWQVFSSGTSQSLNKLFFLNAQLGWAVGDSGTIIKTVDAGNTWNIINSNFTQKLNSVCFVNPNEGWAVGDSGIIIKTNDGGQTWNVQSIAFVDALNDVRFISPLRGWTVGESSMILYTNDGGQTWNQQAVNISGDVFALNEIVFTDSLTGFVTGFAPSIFKTTDGGNTWNRDECAPYNRVINSICNIGQNNIWIAGENGSVLFYDASATSVSLPENNALQGEAISIYPNPTSSNAVLEMQNDLINASLVIYNNLGQAFYSLSNINGKKIELDCSHFVNGIYFLQIKNADAKLLSSKLIIQH
jgi:photosystem II stability/assembly factor-like uncharacterized protein